MQSNIKSTAFVLSVVGYLASTAGAATVLFADNFDRASNDNLNAVGTGKTGTLGPLNWLESNAGNAGNGTNAILNDGSNGVLNLHQGGSTSGYNVAYLDHNFTDASILTAGGFTVTVDLSNVGGTAGGNKNIGIIVGHSSAELSGWTAISPAFPSDFAFTYDPTTSGNARGSYIHTNANGTPAFSDTTVLSAGTTLSVNFELTSFNAGSTVNYEAYIDGNSIDTGSFTWSGTNENFIGLVSTVRSSGSMDDFQVATIPEPSAALLGGLGLLALLRRRRV